MSIDSPLPRDVVLLATADWEHPFWTNKQHMATQLAAAGFRVLYVESLGLRRPTAAARDLWRIAGRLRRAARRVRRVGDNLWVASPLALPWHGNPWAEWLNTRLLAPWIARECRRLGFRNPIAWTYNPLAASLIDAIAPSLLVYHCVDDLSAAPHMPRESIRQAERKLAGAADVVFTTSPALQSQLVAWNPTGTHYLANVADYDHFARAQTARDVPADLAAIPRPRLGFVGAISAYKVDFELIANVARRRPDWQWVLIGQVGEGQPETSVATLRLPNVHLLGPRAYRELPDYLAGFDVATIPARANPYTAAMFPMKFFEYLAAGLPVVASCVPALREFSEACDLVDSPAEFTAAVERLLSGNDPDLDVRLNLARRFTWQARTRAMLAILEQAWAAKNGQTEPRQSLAG